MRWIVSLTALALAACTTPPASSSTTTGTASTVTSTAASSGASSGATVPAPLPSASATAPAIPSWTHGYGWLATPPAPGSALGERVATEAGFQRVPVADDSFAAFLRSLPLKDRGSPVVSFKGETILQPNDPRLVGVVAIDVGDKDLQQCADSIIRMHAEWRWGVSRKDVSYNSLSGFPMSFDRYRRGDRFVLAGKDLSWTTGARADDSHAAFRTYLDGVFMWANTQALARDAKKVARADVRGGDFFVLGGAPGHTVLILDVATDAQGHKHALLGQGYMPAQSFHVVHPEGASAWFSLDGDDVKTPFWIPFPWESLRRLD
ncbi:DUF4846 domain-containing protein [soil metagenome]